MDKDILSLEEQIARLQALLEASRQVHSTIKLDEVLTQTARILVRELEMNGAAFLAPVTGELMVFYGTLPDPPYADCARFPLLSKENVVMAELVVATDTPCLSLYEQDFVEGLVLQAAVALENATFHERDLEWARVQQDLDAARTIQRSLLPKSMPDIPGYSIAAKTTTCYEVGGDYIDTIQLPDGTHLMVVADVAGKGLASAIVATSFRASLRSLVSQPIPLADIVGLVGQQHWEEGLETRRRYVTAIFMRMHLDQGIIEVVNAGHNPGALILPDSSIRMIDASGTPLGMLPGMTYSAETFPFAPGARILLYTDGLTEVFHGEDEFGSERLTEEFRGLPFGSAERMLDSLWDTLFTFSVNAHQTDDMTALAVCHLPPSQQETAQT
ncbi:MAG TPA: PP2C family protein-serine/threonine phosphatase [Acidobacteriaceae bacterium]